MRSKAKIFGTSVIAMGALALCGLPLSAQDSPTPVVSHPMGFAVSAPLRDIARLPQRHIYGFRNTEPNRRIAKRNFGHAVDPVEQSSALQPAANYSIGLNLLGVGNGFPGYNVNAAPPDTNMAVGDTQAVQFVNFPFAVFNKTTGAIEAGPVYLSSLFAGSGLNECANNDDGDIIAQWDNLAHRWLLTQNVFSTPYVACVAISKTPDALGAYYLYQYSLGNGFPDYPKWGRWVNNWSETVNNFGPGGSAFQGPEIFSYNRTKLIAGDPTAEQVKFQLHIGPQCLSQGIGCQDSLLPADIDSPTNPPSAQDQGFIGSVADVDNSHLSLYSVHIDWSQPQNATLTGDNNSQLITVPTYTGSCSGSYGGSCVPQKRGDGTLVDSLGDRLMYRFAYYNEPFALTPPTSPANTPHQHWYVNGDVEASGGQIGVRWYEFRTIQNTEPITALNLFQSGTYAPDSNYRWMGSLTQDKNLDILVGFSESSPTINPEIAVAGRIPTDTPGTLEPEVNVISGHGSQTGGLSRWGDYSAMRIDQDGCTFWYTTEYIMADGSFNWSTQLASAKFANCH